MTVRELIETLNEFNGDLTIYFYDKENFIYSDIKKVYPAYNATDMPCDEECVYVEAD